MQNSCIPTCTPSINQEQIFKTIAPRSSVRRYIVTEVVKPACEMTVILSAIAFAVIGVVYLNMQTGHTLSIYRSEKNKILHLKQEDRVIQHDGHSAGSVANFLADSLNGLLVFPFMLATAYYTCKMLKEKNQEKKQDAKDSLFIITSIYALCVANFLIGNKIRTKWLDFDYFPIQERKVQGQIETYQSENLCFDACLDSVIGLVATVPLLCLADCFKNKIKSYKTWQAEEAKIIAMEEGLQLKKPS